ncbi:MAG: hypothetical protein WCK08_15695 [Betaproteobacteria bacterium]
MGSVYQAFCGCGFQSEVTVGGSRSSFLETSYFPFYCKDCGLVEVNIAKMPNKVCSCSCPECGTQDCTQYGTPPVSLVDLRPKPLIRRLLNRGKEEQLESVTIAWRNREATLKGHLCPSCKEMTLEFSRFPTVMFD